jgi:hypothetical protein
MAMLNGRLYRAAFVPFVIALGIAAFSLGSRPQPLTSTLAPDAFEGAPAYSELQGLDASFPGRRPGSPGDEELARVVAQKLEGLGGTAGGGFSVHTYRFGAETIAGEQTLTDVVARRAGSTSAAPILIVAHRDAAGRGAAAELSGTAALLELARVFAERETKRTIILASTSGGSGGDAGAAQLLSGGGQLGGAAMAGGPGPPLDAAIVLGDLAGTHTHAPIVVPYSSGLGSAPLELQRTVDAAISQNVGIDPGSPSALGQLAHLAFPLSVGEQGALDARGVPAVLVQASGESGPASGAPVGRERLELFGRAVLSAVDALDTAPNVTPSMESDLVLGRKTMPAWVLRLLVLTLLLPPLVAVLDGVARARRRRLPVGRSTLWALSCALPFLSCAVLAYLLGLLGVLGATPAGAVLPGALPFGARAATAVAAIVLTFALSWLLRAMLIRRLGSEVWPHPEVAGLALLSVLLAVALLAWLGNPLTALLAVPALHLWLALADPDRLDIGRLSRRAVSLALVVLGFAPLLLLVLFYARQLDLGVGDVAWMGVLLLAAGHVGFFGAILWSAALGCLAAAVLVALDVLPAPAGVTSAEALEVTIRGPRSYAGPGSLGGTESALRR